MDRFSRPRWSALALIGAAASWGLATVVSKRAVAELPPLLLLTVQLAVSVAALAILMRWRGISWRTPGVPPLLTWLGVLNPGAAYLLGLLGLVSISASLSVLLWAAEPILILLLAALVLGEPLGRRLVAISLLAATGMAILVVDPSVAGGLVGVLLTLAGVACCAVYTIIARRLIGTADGTVPIVARQQLAALLVIGGVTAVFAVGGAFDIIVAITGVGWLSAAASGLLYYAVAYWLYLSALRHVPASIAAASFYLIPAFGLVASFVLLGERLTPQQLVGVGVVAVAVVGSLGATLRAPSRPFTEVLPGPVPERGGPPRP
jgi:probable blue pigment (indigoidine) exporter